MPLCHYLVRLVLNRKQLCKHTFPATELKLDTSSCINMTTPTCINNAGMLWIHHGTSVSVGLTVDSEVQHPKQKGTR